MIEYLRSTTDEVAKADVCARVSELAESYAPDTRWFIATLNRVFELGGDVAQPRLAHNLMRLIAEVRSAPALLLRNAAALTPETLHSTSNTPWPVKSEVNLSNPTIL